ncbi:MAG: aminotransferase class III-fold pyridoxal phosphate-dependent enzyme [Desulfobacterales bacterium]|nr:aminotransferase class III-fold pyridoxal phosphate-dependent enzyme [Desulfobacterales bacterium]
MEAKAPAFSAEEAAEIALRAFDIQASAHPMGSERDQNFRLSAGDGRQWVLKIANPAENPAIIDMQTKALLHIARVDPELAIPRVKTTSDGALFHQIDGSEGRCFIARVLSFLPGRLLDDATPHPALCRDVGAMAARLARALRGFFHPAARHELLWDLTRATGLRALTHHIGEQGRRRVVEKVLDHFGEEVLPRLRKARAQIIHNDISCWNTLVSGDRVSGVIDFGDLIHAPLVADLAPPISELIVESADPIATAAEITAGYHAVTALEDDELDLIFDLVSTRCAMYIVIAYWRVGDHPENTDYIMSGVPGYGTLLEEMQGWERDRMYAGLRRACSTPISIAVPDFTREASDAESLKPMLERRRQRLGPDLELVYDHPLHVVRGGGVWLFDPGGRAFLDAYNNVPQVGHCHPTVVQAIARQAATLNTNTRYLYESAIEYAERLTATMPGELSVCMFVCSGSEANDLAWRLAKAHTGNAGAIVIEDAYHGTTDAVYELSPAEQGEGRPLADHVATAPAPDGYRGKFRVDDPKYADHYAACIDDAIASLDARGFAPAAFYLDLILSSSGILTPPPGYLSAAYEKVRAAGGVCVADEVQSGFGRTGDHFWGFSAHDVVPDIVTLGKPIGNGLSMAAVVTKPEIMASLMEESEFFSTTGGNPVACAAGLAVLDVLEREGLQESAARVGGRLRSRIEKFAGEHPLIGDVRGAGLFIGVEFVRDRSTLEPAAEETAAIVNRMRELGVLVGIDGPYLNVMKIRPPLVFDENHAEQLMDALERALDAVIEGKGR